MTDQQAATAVPDDLRGLAARDDAAVPDRPCPTDEQVDAALAFADRYPGESHTSVLAAKVRGLRAELAALDERAAVAVDTSGRRWAAHAADLRMERDEARAALAARTPQPPGYQRIATAIERALEAADIEVTVTHDGQSSTLYSLARCLDKAGLIDWSEFAAPQPAVPDGQDVPAPLSDLDARQPAAVPELLRLCDEAEQHTATHPVHDDEGRVRAPYLTTAEVRRAVAAAVPGEDVPARLDAAADALDDFSNQDGPAAGDYHRAADDLREAARELRGAGESKALAAVAAALARTPHEETRA